MIKIDWLKCDNKECDKVAFTTMTNRLYEVSVNVCSKHELEFDLKMWDARPLEGNYTT